MARTPQRLVAGNWKMNGTIAESERLALELRRELEEPSAAQIVVCPPFTALASVQRLLAGSAIALGGQNMYFEEKGAFTGEIAPAMLLDAGCRYVILGHSERRRQMGETSQQVNRKLHLALRLGLTPIVCVGETWPERADGHTEEVVAEQVRQSLDGLAAHAVEGVLLAYEPVWAIGTGQVATPEQAAEVHRAIRLLLPNASAQRTRILYGGSVTADNAAALLAQEDVDGALVGGASLNAASFAAIIRAAG